MPSLVLRDTGVSAVGAVPWGTHLCLYYQTPDDLLDVIVPYFAAGLEAGELCVWLPSEPRWEEAARVALRKAVPDFDQRLAAGQIEFIPAGQFYRAQGFFDGQAVMRQWERLDARVHAEQFPGLRGSGDVSWLERADWERFEEYETALRSFLPDRRMLVLCTYPLASSSAADLLDTVHTHDLAIARRNGEWELVESPALKQTKAQIQVLNDQLERAVEERTRQLAEAIETRFAAVLEERARLAREIHDTLLQGVTGIGLQLRAMVPHVSGAPASAVQGLRRIVDQADAAVRDARAAIWDMRSANAPPGDLTATLHETLARASDGLSLCFEVEGTPRAVPPLVEDTVVRVGREAVVNAARHGEATRVSVTLEYAPRALSLRVADDGKGFAGQDTSGAHAGRWGLLGMRERANRVGGSLEIESGDTGTTVELRVPARAPPRRRAARAGPKK